MNEPLKMDVSEYRGSINIAPSKENLTNMENQRSQPNYASVTRTSPAPVFPKKEQAIIMNTIETLTLTDYVVAIGDLVPQPKDITFAFYMSNKRVCIYLSTVELVNQIVNNHSSIKIQDHDVCIRRLITPTRRVILSNICPTIPHEYLEKVLQDLKLKLVSPVSFLRAGITRKDIYGHVFSSRRQVYIQIDDGTQLPSSIAIKFEDTNYRIFLNFDEMKCFICKQEGHIARTCPSQNTSLSQTTLSTTSQGGSELPQESNTSPSRDIPTMSRGGAEQLQESSPIVDNVTKDNQSSDIDSESHHHLQNKRTATTIESTSTSNIPDEVGNASETDKRPDRFKIPKTSKQKRLKRSPSEEKPTPIEEIMEPVKEYFQKDITTSLLTYDQLVDFLSNVEGNPDPISVARDYTDDIPKLLELLAKLYPIFKHRSIKNRITRLRKKMLHQLLNVPESSDTDCSQTSY